MSNSKTNREIASSLKDICRPVKASEEFRQNCLKKVIEEADKISGAKASVLNIQKITVIVHVNSDVLSGFISIPGGARLTDYLNTSAKFIKLTEVSISHENGQIEKAAEVHVNKDAARMIRTLESDAARGTGKRRSIVIRKIPVRAMMQMTDYELSCFLYSKDLDSIDRLLEQRATFLPCTDVNIRRINSDNEYHSGFATINRKRVNSIQILYAN